MAKSHDDNPKNNALSSEIVIRYLILLAIAVAPHLLYTDYTFAVWDADKLVPFAKAYSGLTDAEIRQVDRFVRTHTLERFGPVRSVEPQLVFEIAFEDIRQSSRHKSGIAVRFPRISRWRTDKRIQDADTLQTLKSLLTAA